MFTIIFYVIGMAIWIFGLVLAIGLLFDRFDGGFMSAMIVIMFFGCLGYIPQIPAVTTPFKDIAIRSHAPISVIKTNNVTIVVYQNYKGYVNSSVLNTADYWNSTNILVKYNIGKNIYGNEVMGFTWLECE